MLFFKCIAVQFNHDHNRGEPFKWGLVSYTVVMFLLVTMGTTIQLNIQSISYIDNHGFPPGPAGYQLLIKSRAISVIQNAHLEQLVS